MVSDPKKDPTSLGSILLRMGAISEEELREVIEEQRKLTAETLLGKLLIDHGFCTKDQIEVAIRAQLGMRSEDRTDLALGLAEIASERKRQTNGTLIRVLRKVKDVTSQDYPAMSSEMFGKSRSK